MSVKLSFEEKCKNIRSAVHTCAVIVAGACALFLTVKATATTSREMDNGNTVIAKKITDKIFSM
ncbi:hypothetical protein BG32_02770 [Mesotoga sp. HF07.pep.5.2.highcov]|uniref:hypothetical protein n=1 Tax=Mesotoga sp. HF07.pep.5.2.highcov TaxID=1462923 RepID=UPI0005869E7D|nr:hypothetical protein [Mesotoga sp. HF07.pep.5.2.highcov]RLL92310.1 hypothetical protein BG32_02770 [Mesotoga sp. HF07.pep.5.2.highcov]